MGKTVGFVQRPARSSRRDGAMRRIVVLVVSFTVGLPACAVAQAPLSLVLLPLVRQNAILVAAPKSQMKFVIGEISKLDIANTASGRPTVFPAHPRTQAAMTAAGAKVGTNIVVVDPVGYLEMLLLEDGAEAIVTDSGGVQKEAYFAGRPCITLRERTEWTETVTAGWNMLVGTDPDAIAEAMRHFRPEGDRPDLFGDGHAAERVVEALSTAEVPKT